MLTPKRIQVWNEIFQVVCLYLREDNNNRISLKGSLGQNSQWLGSSLWAQNGIDGNGAKDMLVNCSAFWRPRCSLSLSAAFESFERACLFFYSRAQKLSTVTERNGISLFNGTKRETVSGICESGNMAKAKRANGTKLPSYITSSKAMRFFPSLSSPPPSLSLFLFC